MIDVVDVVEAELIELQRRWRCASHEAERGVVFSNVFYRFSSQPGQALHAYVTECIDRVGRI